MNDKRDRGGEAPTPTIPEVSRRVGIRLAMVGAVVAAAVAAACSPNEEPSAPTVSTTTSTAPTTVAPREEPPEEAPEAEWIVQVGSPADDGFRGLSARGAELVAVGYTEGDLGQPSAGSRDVIVVTVGTDAEVLNTAQAGTVASDEARAVSGKEVTHACGVSGSGEGTGSDPLEAWCSIVDARGVLEDVATRGSDRNDAINGVGTNPNSANSYAVGFTEGFFPAASDPTSGLLGAGDVILWQLDSSGQPTWVRQFGTETRDTGRAVTALGDGDAIAVGDTDGNLSSQSAGGTDTFIARLDASGLPRWIQQFGGEANDTATAVATGGQRTQGTEVFVMAGSTESALAPLYKAADPADPEATESAYGEPAQDPDPGQGDPEEPAPDPEEPGTGPNAPANAGASDAWVAGFGSTGRLIWALQIGTEAADGASAVAIDGSTVLLAGTTAGTINTEGTPAAGGTDGFLAAIDISTGTLRWATQFGTPQNEVVEAITTTEDGLVVVAGRTGGQMGDQVHAGGDDGFLIAFPLPSAGGGAASIL